MKRTTSGFTIVELLIVIVVIAILAAISIVAYTGIQQRANNTAIISAVNQTIKAIQMYGVQEGGYPATDYTICITTDSGCTEAVGVSATGSATFEANMAKVGSLPRRVPTSGNSYNGIIYNYHSQRLYDGQERRAILMYWLNGQNQNCGAPDVMNAWGTPDQPAGPSTTGYTSSMSSVNKTTCWVSLPLGNTL